MSHHWEEYPQAIKEEVLADPTCHDALIESLFAWPMPLGGLEIDSIPGYRLIELLQPGQSLNCVYLAITDPAITPLDQRRAVCIKVADQSMLQRRFSPTELIDCSTAIEREIHVLRNLTEVPELHGKISNFIESGTVRVGPIPIESPFLVTEYVSGVRNAEARDLTSLANIQQLLRILETIHRQGVVHGDLTLENLMVPRSYDIASSGSSTEVPWRIIDFGSAFMRPRWGALKESKRPAFAHRLAGPLDEIRYACAPDASYDVACLALLIQESTDLRFTDATEGSDKALAAFWALATEPRPELRPKDAGEFRDGLEYVCRHERLPWRWSPLPRIRASVRRNPRTAGLAVLITGALAFAATYANDQHQLNTQSRELNARLSQTVDSLIQRNASMLRQITELAAMERIGVGQCQAQIDGLIDESLTLWGNNSLHSDTRIAALHLLVDVADSMSEFQHAEASASCLERCLNAIERIAGEPIASDPMVQLLEIRAKSKLVRLAADYKRPMPSGEPAETVAQAIIQSFLRMQFKTGPSRDAKPSSRTRDTQVARESLRCAENLLANALYPFRGADWVFGPPPLLQQIYDHTKQGIDSEDPNLAVPLADFECQYGFMFHKGFTDKKSVQRIDYPEFAANVQRALLRAQALIHSVPEGFLKDEDSVLFRDLRSRIPNYLGMSYTGEGRFEDARDVLQEALQQRHRELDQAPKSLIWLNRTANTVWNLADSYMTELNDREELDDTRRLELERTSLTYRHEAIALCERWLERDRSLKSEEGYVVNALRAFRSDLALGNIDQGVALLRRAEQRVELQNPTRGHSSGEELMLGASLLHLSDPKELRYRKLYETSISAYREWLLALDQQQEPIPPLQRKKIGMVASTMRWESYAGLRTDARWQEVMDLSDRLSAQ
ncbi:MAG: hypothetical protein WCI02_18630 [Planctomycetota bacterium]